MIFYKHKTCDIVLRNKLCNTGTQKQVNTREKFSLLCTGSTNYRGLTCYKQQQK